MNLQIGQHLFTRDGRKLGNALIVESAQHPVGTVWTCETDFGRWFDFTPAEIESYFYAENLEGEICLTPPDEWRSTKKNYLAGRTV